MQDAIQFLHSIEKNKSREYYILKKGAETANKKLSDSDLDARFGTAYDAGYDVVTGKIEDSNEKALALLTE
jgi:hypothetical protein